MVLNTLTGPNATYATEQKEPIYGLNRVGPRHDRQVGSDASSWPTSSSRGTDSRHRGIC